MTEEEAKAKWCPFARYVFGATDFPAGNRFEGDSSTADEARAGTLCIGSACMAWRTGETTFRSEPAGPQGGYRKVAVNHGFCGLAGQP